MRICLLSATIAPDAVGGRGKYARELYDALKELGVDITVITGLWNRELEDPNIIQVKIPRRRYIWVPFWVRKTRQIIRENSFDVIHINGERESLGYTGTDVPVVSTIHDLGAIQMNMRLLKYILRRNAENAIRIITPSHVVKEELRKAYPALNPDNITPIYNGINFKTFHPDLDTNIIKDRYGLKGPVLLYLGRIAKYKGIEHILKAYQTLSSEIDGLSLIVAGSPTDRMKSTVKTWQNENPTVIFSGSLPEEEVPLYYRAADCFVTYSYAGEGFGLTLAEAMACGTPVVCSDLPAFREVVGTHGVIVPANEPSLLNKALRELLQDQPTRKKLSIEGPKYVRSKYNWMTTARMHLQVYDEVSSSEKVN